MNFEETLSFLYTQLPVYQKEGKTALNKKLDKTIAFCEYLGNPQNQFKSIHVGGTNGKGSTSHLLASVLQQSGLKVGLYTSPHLKRFTERIKVDGKEVEDSFIVDFVALHKAIIAQLKPSFFELTVVMAFDYFARKGVEYAVVEVGLGGRFDSTNIIVPLLSIITNVSYDHTDILGDTLPQIAYEKAGIIKNNIPVVIGEYNDDYYSVIEKTAGEKHSSLFVLESGTDSTYLEKNQELVRLAVNTLNNTYSLKIDDDSIEQGIRNVNSNTGLKGRWQKLYDSPKVICDVGHNEAGFREIIKMLQAESYNKLHWIIGMVSEKEHSKVFKLLPVNTKFYFCGAENQRVLSGDKLLEIAKYNGFDGLSFNNVNEALAHVRKYSNDDDLIMVGGSNFVVAELNEL